MNEKISSSMDVLGGTRVFTGTRVPVQTLLDYLEADQSIHNFLEDFPTVTHDQAVEVIHTARELLLHAS